MEVSNKLDLFGDIFLRQNWTLKELKLRSGITRQTFQKRITCCILVAGEWFQVEREEGGKKCMDEY